MAEKKTIYDCDTSGYWCSEKDYINKDKSFGLFIDNGKAYQINNPDTPRPWLNYLSNKHFGSVISNRGLGFYWYDSSLLRITKYEHPIDYLPREFQDGRDFIITDEDTGESANLLRDAQDLICEHRPGYTKFKASVLDVKCTVTVFVPLEDCCEIILFSLCSDTRRRLKIHTTQVWAFALFGVHSAEDGIPYVSTPGKDIKINNDSKAIYAHSTNQDLPYEMFGLYTSPQANNAKCQNIYDKRKDGRDFIFNHCSLIFNFELEANTEHNIEIISGAENNKKDFDLLCKKYVNQKNAKDAFDQLTNQWNNWIENNHCSIPDVNIQNFLNVWFKNQMHLVFNHVRSGQNGYRDSLQDVWGYTIIDAQASLKRFYEILSYQYTDGTAPRSFSSFNDNKHDLRRFMDSPVWIPRTLIDLVKEIGDFSILDKQVPFINGELASVEEHTWRALDYLYNNRGLHGACLTGDGDWNDALEGISKDGDAVSVWLTIALYDGMKLFAELLKSAGKQEKSLILQSRMAEIKDVINKNSWDGNWYVYGYTGTGAPIGSKDNKEGKIHLNAQTWAVFSGLADTERANITLQSVDKYLNTPLGPVLMNPPYVNDGAEVGRIANLEPGTFENASIYQHAVSFYIFALLALDKSEQAVQILANLLPTNPDNFDTRRTSEPYCTGNYYCGPNHPRFGQNFFTWFTGNAAWLMRAGFDNMLGVKAGFNGLEISPCVPHSWKTYTVVRNFRNCSYTINFKRQLNCKDIYLLVDGNKIDGNVIPVSRNSTCCVEVEF